jgi:hypothetical protein
MNIDNPIDNPNVYLQRAVQVGLKNMFLLPPPWKKKFKMQGLVRTRYTYQLLKITRKA